VHPAEEQPGARHEVVDQHRLDHRADDPLLQAGERGEEERAEQRRLDAHGAAQKGEDVDAQRRVEEREEDARELIVPLAEAEEDPRLEERHVLRVVPVAERLLELGKEVDRDDAMHEEDLRLVGPHRPRVPVVDLHEHRPGEHGGEAHGDGGDEDDAQRRRCRGAGGDGRRVRRRGAPAPESERDPCRQEQDGGEEPRVEVQAGEREQQHRQGERAGPQAEREGQPFEPAEALPRSEAGVEQQPAGERRHGQRRGDAKQIHVPHRRESR
jgi:hypothetical protein